MHDDAGTAALEVSRRDEAISIPSDFDFAAISGLSNELRQKLEAGRPATLSQASRIDGMTPAALLLIRAILKRQRTDRQAAPAKKPQSA